MDERIQQILRQRHKAATHEGPERLRLLELIQSLAYKDQTCILTSGKHSDFYVDCRQVTLFPEAMHLIGSEMIRMMALADAMPDAICGVVLGGLPIAMLTSICRHGHRAHAFTLAPSQAARDAIDQVLPEMPVLAARTIEKKHGTRVPVEGSANVAKGSSVAVVDDVISSGSSTLSAIHALEQIGYHVTWVGCLVDRQEGGKEVLKSKGHRLYSLFTADEVRP